jgi:hypothetical protein
VYMTIVSSDDSCYKFHSEDDGNGDGNGNSKHIIKWALLGACTEEEER